MKIIMYISGITGILLLALRLLGTVMDFRENELMLIGGLILVGLVFLADSLHLFGPFRLVHLGPFVLILAGIIALNRALRSS